MVSIPFGTQFFFSRFLYMENLVSGCDILNLFVSLLKGFLHRVIFENSNLLPEAPVVQKLDSAI